MSSDSMLVFREADASAMSEVFAKKATLVREFMPDVRDGVVDAVGEWTGEARTACDEALERLVRRGEELADLLQSASEAMDKIRQAGQHAETMAFAHIDS